MADFSLGQAILGTGVDLSGIQKGLAQAENETKQKAGGIGGFFGKAFEFATGGLIASGISALSGVVSGFVTDAFADARETQQLMAQTNAVITSTGGAAGVTAQHVADLASSLSDAAGKSLFGDDQIQASTNLLLTFTNLKGAVLDSATAISVDMAQAMGGAPKDSAIQLGKALNDPINGITALSRVGVTFTEQQKEQIKAMQEAGDMAGAQGIILAELNKEFGGSAQAAAGATGGWAEFQGRLGEATETIATAVLPIIGKLGSIALDFLIPAIEDVANAVGPVIASFEAGGESSETLGVILGALGDVWEQLQGIIDVAVKLINATIVPAFSFIAGFIQEHSDTILRVLSNVWTAIKAAIDIALTLIKGVLTVALQLIQGDWSGAWETIKETAARIWDDIKAILGAAWDNIKALFGGFASDALQLGADMINGIVDGVKNAASHLANSVANAAKDALDAAKHALGISSPSKLFADEVGANITAGIALGIDQGADQIGDALGGAFPRLSTTGALAGAGGGQTLIFNIDARGATMSAAEFEAAVRRVLTQTTRNAEGRVKLG